MQKAQKLRRQRQIQAQLLTKTGAHHLGGMGAERDGRRVTGQDMDHREQGEDDDQQYCDPEQQSFAGVKQHSVRRPPPGLR